jgi:hypothetical protein
MIYPWDTYTGFRELGFNILFSVLATFIINVNFSYPTRLAYSWLPDPWFRVYITSIHKAKVSSSEKRQSRGDGKANAYISMVRTVASTIQRDVLYRNSSKICSQNGIKMTMGL